MSQAEQEHPIPCAICHGTHEAGQCPQKLPGSWRTPLPMLYAVMVNGIREIAAKHGYCLAVHGSMARDFDLVAIPWSEPLSPPSELVSAIKDSCGWLYKGDPIGPEKKPHGRLAWMIPLGLGTAIDLSVLTSPDQEAKP